MSNERTRLRTIDNPPRELIEGPRLVLLDPATGKRTRRVVFLHDPEVEIGRDRACGVLVEDPEISRRHARLTRFGESYAISDLGSANGTMLNGLRVTGPQSLRHGDLVRIGGVRLEYLLRDPDQSA